MKTDHNKLQHYSILYSIIEEIVFLKETERVLDYTAGLLKIFFQGIQLKYRNFIQNELNQGYLALAAYMGFSTFLMLVAYKLVMIF